MTCGGLGLTRRLGNAQLPFEKHLLVVHFGDFQLRQYDPIGGRQDLIVRTSGIQVQETVAQSATYTGVNLRCLAPVLLGAGRDSTGAMTINWTRRTRIGGEWLDSVDAQLGEPAQTYELEIWNPGFTILRRTVTALVTPTYAYSTAFQSADSYAVFAAVSIRVFQISAVTGRGYTGQGVV